MDVNVIKSIIAKHAKIDEKSLNLDARFKEDLHLDSIDLFQIVMEVEEKYNIKVDDKDLLYIKTVKDALDKIENAKN